MIQDIRYGENEHQRLDLYLPHDTKAGVSPLALVIHGGGWAIGDKGTGPSSSLCRHLSENGIVAASINYKLISYAGEPWKSEVLESAWPENILDCQRALSFLIERHAEYHINPQKIVPVGFSAGAHLALLLSYAQGQPWLPPGPSPFKKMAGVVDCYGIHDLHMFGAHHFGKTPEESLGNISQASPVTYLNKSVPPTFIIHGGNDKTVKIEVSIDLANKLEQAGASYHFWQLPDTPHSFHIDETKPSLRDAVTSFIKTAQLPKTKTEKL